MVKLLVMVSTDGEKNNQGFLITTSNAYSKHEDEWWIYNEHIHIRNKKQRIGKEKETYNYNLEDELQTCRWTEGLQENHGHS